MILNFKDRKADLPAHLRSDLVGIGEGSLEALHTYLKYMGTPATIISRIVFYGGNGDISSKCEWAAEIAKVFDCPVEFDHNTTPTICYRDTAAAAYAIWNERHNNVAASRTK